MIIFLYGQDTYRVREKLNEIIAHYKKIHKSGLNLKYFYGERLNYQSLKDDIKQVSMFKEKKLAILNTALLDSEFKEKFLKEAKSFIESEDIVLFYNEGEADKKDSLSSFLIKNAKSQEFKPLGGQRLKNWIKKEFENHRASIEREALEQLINFVGNDLWRAHNEIKKLIDYKKGQKIMVKDVELLVKPKIETDIFKTIDALAGNQKKLALELLHKHLQIGDSPLYLLSMINFQFRNLLIVKDFIEKKEPFYLLSKETKLHPFVAKKSYSQAQKFTISELKKIYQKIFQVDLDIKTGKIEPETALDLFIAEI